MTITERKEKTGQTVRAEKPVSARTSQKQGRELMLKLFRGRACDAARLLLLGVSGAAVMFDSGKSGLTMLCLLTAEAAAGTLREYRCIRTAERIRRAALPRVGVRKDGETILTCCEDIREGDIFEIGGGELFPCDCVILEQQELTADEALLTGDHSPAVKTAYSGEELTEKLGLPYIGYSGTAVLTGSALCRARGRGSEIFRRMPPVRRRSEPLVTDSRTRAERAFTVICAAAGAVSAAVGIIRGGAVLQTVSLALTASAVCIPDRLSSAAELTSARIRRLLLKKGTVVRDTAALERLGRMTVLLADHRGIVAGNSRTVRKLCIAADGREFDYSDVTGRLTSGRSEDGYMAWENSALSETMICAAVCCKARRVRKTTANKRNRRTVYEGSGDDAALLGLCAACGIEREMLLVSKLGEKPAEGEKRYNSVSCRLAGGEIRVYHKGAPDSLLPICTGVYGAENAGRLAEMSAKAAEMAGEGMTVTAFCETAGGRTLLLGLAGISSPISAAAGAAVRSLRRNGVRTVMMTDDERVAAAASAKSAGIMTEGKRCCTGAELDEMTDEQLTAVSGAVTVYARAEPRHKAWIAEFFGRSGSVCAASVSGAEEAALLSETDALICAPAAGNESVKQSAEVVVGGGLEALAGAVGCGRALFSSLRGRACVSISFAVTVLAVLLISSAFGMRMPFTAPQLLLAAVLTEPAAAEALSVVREKGRFGRSERRLFSEYLTHGLLGGFSLLGCYTVLLRTGSPAGACTAVTAALALMRLMTVTGVCGSTRIPVRAAAAVLISAAAVSAAVCLPIGMRIFGFSRLTPFSVIAVVVTAVLPTSLSGLADMLRRRKSV